MALHDLPVDFAHQDHPDNVEGVGIGDPEAVHGTRFLAQPLQEGADLGAAPVDDHRQHADRAHQHDVLGEGGQRRVLVDRAWPGLA